MGAVNDRPASSHARVFDRRYAVAVGLAFAGVTGFALWILSSRFGIDTPSLIDDWLFATAPAPSFGDQVQFFFEPTLGRFRPTYEIFSLAQWHTFGAPQDMLVPNIFAVVRSVGFCVAVVAVPGLVVATGRPGIGPWLLGGLCLAAGLIIFSNPVTDGNFLSQGAQEPLLVGTLVTGLALVAWATGRLLGDPRSTVITWVPLIGGFLIWSLGIYYKEASVVMLVGAPFLYLHLDRRWRESGLIQSPLWRQRCFQLVTAAMLVPAVHVMIGITAFVEGGAGYYGAEQPSSLSGWIERGLDAADVVWDTSAFAGLTEWRYILAGLIVAVVVVAVRDRKVPWLPAGCLVTGVALTVFQGVLLELSPRYLLPGIGLFTIAGVLLLAELPPWLGWPTVAAALAITAMDAREVRDGNELYARWQEGETGALEIVNRLNPATCPVYMKNMGGEIGDALPKVIGLLEEPPGVTPCPRGFEGMIVGFDNPPVTPYLVDDSAIRACADRGGPALVHRSEGAEGIPQGAIEIRGCRNFAKRLDGRPTSLLLDRNRLVPGVGISAYREGECARRNGAEACVVLHEPG